MAWHQYTFFGLFLKRGEVYDLTALRNKPSGFIFHRVMGKKTKKQMGAKAFEDFYQAKLGSRWEKLKEAFIRETQYQAIQFSEYPPYYIDIASALCAAQLEILPGESFLDMCSAPGGKALALLQKAADPARIVLNDVSNSRRLRLVKVLKDHLPEDIRLRIHISGRDGKKPYAFGTEGFDKILLDAPCSSERHVWQSAKHLSTWTEGRAHKLAKEQWGLIKTAVRILKPGGELLYSTCALNPAENEGLVGKVLDKFKGAVSPVSLNLSLGEAGEFGWLLWPDICGGTGPIYMVKLKKGGL